MASQVWEPCLVDPMRGIAFFDGVTIESEAITTPHQYGALPVLEEDILVCRQARRLLKPGLRVLDLYTGNGVYAVWAAKAGCRVTAVGNATRPLAVAYHNAKRNNVEGWSKKTEAPAEKTIEFLYETFEKDCTETDAFKQKFDRVFLHPPCTPTCPGIIPAGGRGAGEEGTEIFNEVIPRVVAMLKDGGICIGGLLTPVRKDGKIEAVMHIDEVFNGSTNHKLIQKDKYRIRYARILQEDIPSEEFLRQQYQTYLDLGTNGDGVLVKSPTDVSKYITDVSKQYPHFALIYFEVEKNSRHDNAALRNPEEVKNLVRSPNITWVGHSSFHRHLVDHNMSRPLFMPAQIFGGSTGELPTGELTQEIDVRKPPLFKDTPLPEFERWMRRTLILQKDTRRSDPLFDFVIVEAIPLNAHLKERSYLFNHVMVTLTTNWAKGTEQEIVNILSEITRTNQRAQTGTIMHKHFVKTRWPDRGTYSHQGARAFHIAAPQEEMFLCDERRAELFKFIEERMEDAEEELRSQTHWATPKVDEHGYCAISLQELGVLSEEQLEEYWQAVERRLYRGGFSLDPDGKKRPLERDHFEIDAALCSAASHKRLHNILDPLFQNNKHPSEWWSVKIGVPLSINNAATKQDYHRKTEGYSGAVYLYAGSHAGPWSLEHEEWLCKAIQRLWMYYMDRSGDAVASNMATIEWQLMSEFGHEVKHIADAISSRWFLDPGAEVRAMLQAMPNKPCWANLPNWRLVPFPDVLEAAGRTIRLWCQLDKPERIFGSEAPKTMDELIQRCWKLAKDILKTMVCYRYNVPVGGQIQELGDALQEVDALWDKDDLFCLTVAEGVPDPDWTVMGKETDLDPCARWMIMTRFLVATFTNCVQHAHAQKNIHINVTLLPVLNEDEVKLSITVENDKKDDEDTGVSLATVRAARSKVAYHSAIDEFRGEDNLRSLAKQLGGQFSSSLAETKYWSQVTIPTKTLN